MTTLAISCREFDQSPPAPATFQDPDGDLVFLGGRPYPDFVIGEDRGRSYAVFVSEGAVVALETVIAFALDRFYASEETPPDMTIWRHGRAVAVLRPLPEGRREVLVLDGESFERRRYPPNILHLEHLDKVRAATGPGREGGGA